MIRLLVVASLALASCVPAAFRPARTVPKGEVEHTVGTMVYSTRLPNGADAACTSLLGCERQKPNILLPGASYTLRYGAAPGLDIGIGASTPTALSLDATVRLLETSFLDVAVGPSLVWDILLEAQLLSAVLLVDLNLSQDISMIAMAAPSRIYPAEREHAAWLLQGTAGLDLRLTSLFSLRPHVGFIRGLDASERDEVSAVPFAGMGLAFGGQRGRP